MADESVTDVGLTSVEIADEQFLDWLGSNPPVEIGWEYSEETGSIFTVTGNWFRGSGPTIRHALAMAICNQVFNPDPVPDFGMTARTDLQ